MQTSNNVRVVVLPGAGTGEWEVWATLKDHNPILDPFGFIVGVGQTRDAAVANAVEELEAAIDELQSGRPK